MDRKFNEYKSWIAKNKFGAIICMLSSIVGVWLFTTDYYLISMFLCILIYIVFVANNYYSSKYVWIMFFIIVVGDIASFLVKDIQYIYIKYFLLYCIFTSIFVVVPLIVIKFIIWLPLGLKKVWFSKERSKINGRLSDYLFEYRWDYLSPYSLVDYYVRENFFKCTKGILYDASYKYMIGYELYLAIKEDLNELGTKELIDILAYLDITNNFTKEKKQWYRNFFNIVVSGVTGAVASVASLKLSGVVLEHIESVISPVNNLFFEIIEKRQISPQNISIYWMLFICVAIVAGIVSKILSDRIEIKRRKNLNFFLRTIVEKILDDRKI